jgi:hypothetical protein
MSGAFTNGRALAAAAATAHPPIMKAFGRPNRSTRLPTSGIDGISIHPMMLTMPLASGNE